MCLIEKASELKIIDEIVQPALWLMLFMLRDRPSDNHQLYIIHSHNKNRYWAESGYLGQLSLAVLFREYIYVCNS